MSDQIIYILQWYISVGCSMYVILVIKDATQGFINLKGASTADILRGIGAIFLWPYIFWHMEIGTL